MYSVWRCTAKRGKVYQLVNQNLDWNSAWHYCNSHFRNSQLVAIRSQEEQDALVSYLKSVWGQQHAVL